MASEDMSDKCERLMWKVIEMRKHYGKQCVEYQKKSAQCEMSLLKLNLNSISKWKPPTEKCELAKLPYDQMLQEMDDFKTYISTNEKKKQDLMKKIKTAEDIAVHINSDRINKIAKSKFTAKTFLMEAKSAHSETSPVSKQQTDSNAE